MMNRKRIVIYLLNFLIGGIGFWFVLAELEPFKNAILNNDIIGLSELKWYELIIGLVGIIGGLYLMIRSIIYLGIFAVLNFIALFMKKESKDSSI